MASGLSDIEKEIMAKAKEAMEELRLRVEDDINEGLDYFYQGGTPVMYKRTGALGDTPELTSVYTRGNTVGFKAYLDKTHIYGTGKSPGMDDVLDLANYGYTYSRVGELRPTVGSMGFWERIEENIQKSFDDVMSKYFS